MYLSVIGTLICRIEMRLVGSISFGFAQNTEHDFRNTVLNSWWRCLRRMPQKKTTLPVNTQFYVFFGKFMLTVNSHIYG